MEDREIVDLYWQRSERAIEESSLKYGSYCMTIATHILGSRPDAEECVNDTWFQAWRAIPPHRPERLSVFLGRITRNLSINLSEKNSAAKRGGQTLPAALDELSECVPSPQNVEEEAEGRQLTESINHFLSELPKEKRIIFVKRYWYLLPVREIAQSLGIGESKVKMTLLRTRNELKQYLEREGVSL